MASDIRGLECAEGGKVIFRKWFEKEFLCRKFMVWRIVIRQEKDTHSLKANRNRQMHVLPSANRLCEVHVTYFCGDVYFCWVRYIAAYWKSSNTFCLFPKQPAWCHVSPYSLERKTEGIELPWKKNPHWITQGDLHQVWAPLCICTGRQVPCRSWNKPLLYSI